MNCSPQDYAKMIEKLQGNGRVSKYAISIAALDGKEMDKFLSDHNSFSVELPNGCPVVTYNLCVPGSPGEADWGQAPYLDENVEVINQRIKKGLLGDRFKQQILDIQEYAAANPSAILCFQEFKFEIVGEIRELEIPTDFLKGSLENWSAYKMDIKDADRLTNYAFGNLVLFNPQVWEDKSSLEMKGKPNSSYEGLRHQEICLKHRVTDEDWTFLNGHNKWSGMKREYYDDVLSFYKDFLNSPGNRFIAGDLYLDHKKLASYFKDLCKVYASVDGSSGSFFHQKKTADYIFVKEGAQGQKSRDLHKGFFTEKKGTLIQASTSHNSGGNILKRAQTFALEKIGEPQQHAKKIKLSEVMERPNIVFPMQLATKLLRPLMDKLNQDQMEELLVKLKEPLGLKDHEDNLFNAFSNRLKPFGRDEMLEKRKLAQQWKVEIEKIVDIHWHNLE